MSTASQMDLAQFIQHLKNSLFTGITGAFLMIAGLFSWLPTIDPANMSIFWLAISALTLSLMIYAGRQYFIGAWVAFTQHKANMDTLIALGTGSAWVYSTLVAAVPHWFLANSLHVYFESPLIILALINLGAALELRARSKTTEAIKQLMNLQPKTAIIKRGDQEIKIPVADIQPGDFIRIRPGENIPVDGIVVEGESHIDESMLTGESSPIAKSKDDFVSTGTNNLEGTFLMKAQAVGANTVLAKIIDLVRQAQYTKPPIAKLTDTVSGIFVPLVMILTILTGLFWYNFGQPPILPTILITCSSVLLIACPCALGLATPISLIAGMGKGAAYGILIRNGEALQRATELTTLVLDKTGTVTEGKPTVTAIYTHSMNDQNQILTLAASVEQFADHPWATAITTFAQQQKLRLASAENFINIAGKGIQAFVQGKKVLIGNAALMNDNGVDVSLVHNLINKCRANAQTPIFVARNKEILGIIAVADPIKPGVKNVIKQLQAKGLNVVLLTGDNAQTANTVAKSLNISTVIAEVLPDQKAQKILHLQQRGQVVGMVGDGINDAPALAQADVGFAIGTGTDVAINSSDVTLLSGHLTGVINAITLSQKVMRNIKQNLFGAFFYNVLSIPIAAGVLYPWFGVLLSPMIAGGAMAASSLSVVLNANRLRKIQLIRSP